MHYYIITYPFIERYYCGLFNLPHGPYLAYYAMFLNKHVNETCISFTASVKDIQVLFYKFITISQRTSDGGNGNHSVSLPITLLKNKVDQMLPSVYISSLLVSI